MAGYLPRREQLAAIGQVHWYVSFPLAVSALTSIILGGVAAYEYNAVAANIKDTSAAGLTAALYVAASLQLLLLLLLVIRGLVGALTHVFTFNFVQMIMVIHCFVPNLIITGLWTARIMIDANVSARYNVDGNRPFDGHLKAAYALHTITMVFSNIYSAYALSVIFANTAFFNSMKIAGSGEGVERNPKEFAYYGAERVWRPTRIVDPGHAKGVDAKYIGDICDIWVPTSGMDIRDICDIRNIRH